MCSLSHTIFSHCSHFFLREFIITPETEENLREIQDKEANNSIAKDTARKEEVLNKLLIGLDQADDQATIEPGDDSLANFKTLDAGTKVIDGLKTAMAVTQSECVKIAVDLGKCFNRMIDIFHLNKRTDPSLKGKTFNIYFSKSNFGYSRSYIYFLRDLYLFVKDNPKFKSIKGFSLADIKDNFKFIKDMAKDKSFAHVFGSEPIDPNQGMSRNKRRKLPLRY